MLRKIFKSYRALPLRRNSWRSLTLDRADRGPILSGHLRRGCGKYNYWEPTHRVDFMLARTQSRFWIR